MTFLRVYAAFPTRDVLPLYNSRYPRLQCRNESLSGSDPVRSIVCSHLLLCLLPPLSILFCVLDSWGALLVCLISHLLYVKFAQTLPSSGFLTHGSM